MLKSSSGLKWPGDSYFRTLSCVVKKSWLGRTGPEIPSQTLNASPEHSRVAWMHAIPWRPDKYAWGHGWTAPSILRWFTQAPRVAFPCFCDCGPELEPSISFFLTWRQVSNCCCCQSQSCPTLCDPMDCSTLGLPVPYHLPEFAQVRVHCIGSNRVGCYYGFQGILAGNTSLWLSMKTRVPIPALLFIICSLKKFLNFCVSVCSLVKWVLTQ